MAVVVYLEPGDERNLRVPGFDMYSEPVRRETLDRARDWASDRIETGSQRYADLRDRADGPPDAVSCAPEQAADLEKFEGNAQGFRIVTRLQSPSNPGMQLTGAVLGAFTKYPRPSHLAAPLDGRLRVLVLIPLVELPAVGHLGPQSGHHELVGGLRRPLEHP